MAWKQEVDFYLKILIVFCVIWIALIFTANTYIMTKRANDAMAVNAKVIFAVCKRFSADETLDEQTTQKLASVARNPKARQVLSKAYQLKKNQLQNFCPKAMANAEVQFNSLK
jgi:ABC-type transport system involved in cytochrome bd biosynthesis fused ATPase/permease subunit